MQASIQLPSKNTLTGYEQKFNKSLEEAMIYFPNVTNYNMIVGTTEHARILKIPFDEILQIKSDFRDKNLLILCDTTEEPKWFSIRDWVILGDLEQWCKDSNVEIKYSEANTEPGA